MDERRLMVRAIGVIVPSNVGDAVLALPTVAALAALFPKAALTIIGGSRARAVFDADPRLAAYVEYGTDGHTWRDYACALRALRRESFDLLLDLRHTLMPWLLRARRRTSPLQSPPATLRHRHDRYHWHLAQLLRAFQTEMPVSTPASLWQWSAEERAAVEQLLAPWRLTDAAPVLVLSPGARSDGKRWPSASFAQLGDRLIEATGAHVMLTGERCEEPIIRDVQRAMRHAARSAAGQTTVRTLAYLLTRVQAVVTNDSATLHVASSINAPTVALFGPTDPAKYGPRSCSSLVIHRYPIADILVEEVFQAARGIVERQIRNPKSEILNKFK